MDVGTCISLMKGVLVVHDPDLYNPGCEPLTCAMGKCISAEYCIIDCAAAIIQARFVGVPGGDQ